MCGTGSMFVTFVAGLSKVIFAVDADGSLATSHSQVRTAAKIKADAKMLNLNYDGSDFRYDKGEPKWYAPVKASTEKAVARIFKAVEKSGPAYAKRLEVAQRVLDRELVAASKLPKAALRNAASKNAQAKYAASKAKAFATLRKLGGFAL